VVDSKAMSEDEIIDRLLGQQRKAEKRVAQLELTGGQLAHALQFVALSLRTGTVVDHVEFEKELRLIPTQQQVRDHLTDIANARQERNRIGAELKRAESAFGEQPK
jgi:hypothetical protein